MTERLYYTDSYCTHFSAYVVEQLVWDGRPAVVLDRTAFYPTSGGQPADRGMLGGVTLLDTVVREEDGAIIHVLERPLPETRREVEGLLDWSRRFDHMQQHTGQHILSAAFEQVLDADTIGFHLGTEVSTLDINRARLEPAAVAPVEELANQVIWENRPVSMHVVNPDELAALPLRRPPTVEGPVRIVDIAGFDVNPCGGTHVAHTGEIGLIKILRLNYRGSETRVEFLCGRRALHDYRARNEMVNRLTGMLTVGHQELDQAVERLQVETRQLRQELRKVHKRLLNVEADELVETAVVHEPYRVVWRVLEERDADELRALTQGVVQYTGIVALLASVGEKTHLCFARAEGVDLNVAGLLREACTQLGGKGGGQPHLAQGSAPTTDVAHVNAVLASLSSSLGSHTTTT